MKKEELALAARRFTCAVEGLDFKGVTHQHKDKDKDDKAVSTPSHEVRRGSAMVLPADSEEEASQLADKLNNLINPFIQDEFERLRKKLEEYNS